MTFIAVSHWQSRVSPVFDVAEQLFVIELKNGCQCVRRLETLDENQLSLRADHLVALKIDVLICGAISSPLNDLLLASHEALD